MNTTPLEYHEAVTLAEYLEILKNKGKIVLYTHIPAETYTKSWITKGKNRAMGVRKGFPDYFIVTKRRAIAIELKRTQGSSTSEEQLLWIAALNGAGIPTKVCKGFTEAQRFIEEWL